MNLLATLVTIAYEFCFYSESVDAPSNAIVATLGHLREVLMQRIGVSEYFFLDAFSLVCIPLQSSLHLNRFNLSLCLDLADHRPGLEHLLFLRVIVTLLHLVPISSFLGKVTIFHSFAVQVLGYVEQLAFVG